MRVKIYQINLERDVNRIKFESLDRLEKWYGSTDINPGLYDEVFNAELDTSNLEEIFRRFNLEGHPLHRGHSLSVSDIVVTDDGAFYCDSIGFKKVDFDITRTRKPESLLRVVYVEPNKPAFETEVDHSLEAEKKAVGGYIELVYNGDGTVIICNEEAKLKNMESNRRLGEADFIAGPFFICGVAHADFRSLTEAEVNKYLERYAEPEQLSESEFQEKAYVYSIPNNIGIQTCMFELIRAYQDVHDLPYSDRVIVKERSETDVEMEMEDWAPEGSDHFLFEDIKPAGYHYTDAPWSTVYSVMANALKSCGMSFEEFNEYAEHRPVGLVLGGVPRSEVAYLFFAQQMIQRLPSAEQQIEKLDALHREQIDIYGFAVEMTSTAKKYTVPIDAVMYPKGLSAATTERVSSAIEEVPFLSDRTEKLTKSEWLQKDPEDQYDTHMFYRWKVLEYLGAEKGEDYLATVIGKEDATTLSAEFKQKKEISPDGVAEYITSHKDENSPAPGGAERE